MPKFYLLENFYLALRSVRVNKLRTILTSLGIIIGVASVVVVISIIESYNQQVLENMASGGANTVQVSNGSNENFFGFSSGTESLEYLEEDERAKILLTDLDVLAIQRNIEGVSFITPHMILNNWPRKVSYGKENLDYVRIEGVTQEYALVKKTAIKYGRFINNIDNYHQKSICVLSEGAIKSLKLPKNPVGISLSFDGKWFKVVGVVKNQGFFDMFNQNIFIPYTTAKYFNNQVNPKISIFFTLDNINFVNTVTRQVRQLLNIRHGLKINSQRFKINTANQQLKELKNQMAMAAAVFVAIVGISLLVGGIGIMNIMMVSVTERTKEIGISKALGASRIHILLQFLIEALIVSLLAGIIGLLLGALITGIVTTIIESLPTIWFTFKGSVIAFICAVGTGIIFGIMPAAKASKLNPIESLRYE